MTSASQRAIVAAESMCGCLVQVIFINMITIAIDVGCQVENRNRCYCGYGGYGSWARQGVVGIRFRLRPLELLLPRPEDDNGAVL